MAHSNCTVTRQAIILDDEPERAVRELQIYCRFTPQNSLAAVHYHTATHRVRSKNSASTCSGLVTSESFVSTVASFS